MDRLTWKYIQFYARPLAQKKIYYRNWLIVVCTFNSTGTGNLYNVAKRKKEKTIIFLSALKRSEHFLSFAGRIKFHF